MVIRGLTDKFLTRYLPLALAALFVFVTAASHASMFAGRPPIARFAPDIDAYPQNFAIEQGSRGIVYVGNADGVLEYDAEQWRLTRLPNGDIARSLAIAADGTVFVGGFNLFGYLKRDATGTQRFVNLSARFAEKLGGREIGDVWQTLATPEGVYFRGLHDIFFWDPVGGTSGHWQHEARFGKVFRHGEQTLLQFRDEGLRVRVGDKWQSLAHTSALKVFVYVWAPLPDGSMLGGVIDGSWIRLTNREVTSIKLPAALSPSTQFTSALPLADKSIAMTTNDGRVVIYDPAYSTVRQFNIDSEFLAGISTAVEGAMLVAGQDAIYRIAWPSPWTTLGPEDGAQGSLNALADWNGARYLLTSAGVWQAKTTASRTSLRTRTDQDRGHLRHAGARRQTRPAGRNPCAVDAGKRRNAPRDAGNYLPTGTCQVALSRQQSVAGYRAWHAHADHQWYCRHAIGGVPGR